MGLSKAYGVSHKERRLLRLSYSTKHQTSHSGSLFSDGSPPYDVSVLAVGEDVTPVKMHGDTHSARTEIPTAHIIGRSDAYREFSKVIVTLCNPQETKVFDHKGAHVVPRGQEAVEDLTAALNWVVDRAMYQ